MQVIFPMNRIASTVAFLLVVFGLGFQSTFAQSEIDFAKQIRPILSDKCFACHGPDEHTREADLRLDQREQALEILSPGQIDDSEFVRRILTDDPDELMPPAKSHKTLSADEITLLKKWIAEGAEYEEHWSFRPLARTRLPAIKHHQNKNAIDALVIDALSGPGLQMSPQADEVTLVRRLYQDLLGVPPSPAEVDAFVNDESADAWEQLVDKLLDDHRYGERMAVYWLDLVRYADTIGYHSDASMEVSAYRDYVIDAFNENKPFDQFTIEQLAGDLIPDATDQQRIASGYNRLLQTTEEGGAQAKEYIAIYAADRVRNVSGVWMGLTVGCAQCHDHKYDPITAKDFYSLAAFFSDIKETAVGRRKPNFKIVTDQQKAHAQSLRDKVATLKLEKRLSDPAWVDKLNAGQAEWEAQKIASLDSGESIWQSPEPAAVKSSGGVQLKRQDDGTYLATANNPNHGDYTYTIKNKGTVRAIQLEIFPDPTFKGFSRGNGNIVLTGVTVKANGKDVKISDAKADFEQAGWPVVNTLDKNKKTGWAVDGHTKKADSHTAVFVLEKPIEFGEQAGKIEIGLQHQSVHVKHLIGRFRVSISDSPDASLGNAKPLSESVTNALRKPAADRSDAEKKTLADHYRTFAPAMVEAKRQLAAAEKELADYEKTFQTTLVSEALGKPRMTRILPRGNWLDDSGEEVMPAVPHFMPHDEINDRRANRMDLAKWLFRKDNPTTARTFANRIWKLFFGRGLSRNLDDLGGQGEPPTHPELLDWLALEFQESGWDVKQLVRLIVTSGTYAQSSNTTEQVRQQDANNDWFARQGRWRVEAEFVRDTALQLGGLLQVEPVGGRSVKPYQPAGYWRHLNFPKRTWAASKGNDLYRRTLYTFWCRSFLHPSLLAFDAPSREECTAQRARSNIPQQALALLNDPVFVESARAFAARIIASADNDDDRLAWAFREATSRKASVDELQVLKKLLQTQAESYRESEEDANAITSVGDKPNPDAVDKKELATWTQIARAILNVYETTSRY